MNINLVSVSCNYTILSCIYTYERIFLTSSIYTMYRIRYNIICLYFIFYSLLLVYNIHVFISLFIFLAAYMYHYLQQLNLV